MEEFWHEFGKNEPNKNIWSGVSTALLTIAGLTPSNYNIEFVDENYDSIDFLKEYDLVGISVMTANAMRAYAIADKFRENKIKVVLGGVHPTLLPEEAKLHADSIVIGEAEYLWRELLDDFEKKSLKPFYKSEKKVNLEDSPMPRYDLLKAENYSHIWLQTTRGCPHDCEYCTASKIFGSGYRRKSDNQILNELKYIKNHFPNKQIFFADDNFFAQRKAMIPLLKQIANLKCRWNAQCDIAVGEDPDFIKLLRKSGCVLLFIGIETISEEGLISLDSQNWKYKQLKNLCTYINNIQQNGVGVMGSFMVGLDSDDNFIFKKLSNFIIDNYLYHASITILTPVFGTRLRSRLEKENRILPTTSEKYTGYNVNFIPKKMTIQELENGLVSVFKTIFSKEILQKKMEYFKQIQKKIILQEEKILQ